MPIVGQLPVILVNAINAINRAIGRATALSRTIFQLMEVVESSLGDMEFQIKGSAIEVVRSPSFQSF